jgi:uncharacterized protein (TIGR02001 family)
LTTVANAQVSGSASLLSDYQYRGLSLSDGRPALSLSLSYDTAMGAYVGGSAIAETGHGGVRMLGHVEYLGYARRTASDLTWDIGVTNQHVTKYYDQNYELNYTQIYAGLKYRSLSYYIYYSPDYFAEHYSTVYVDVSGGFRPARRIRVFGHVGALAAFGANPGPASPAVQVDLRAGVAAEFRHGELELSWGTALGRLNYLAGVPQRRAAPVLTALVFF